MRFYLKRYVYVVSKNRKRLPLILAPLVIYLLSAAAIGDRFLVTQKIRLPQDSPIASARGPIEVIRPSDLISHPEDLFQDQFALVELANHLYAFPELGQNGHPASVLRAVCQRDMSLTKQVEDVVTVSYFGPNQALGEMLVGFFSQRLLARSEEGLERSNRQTPGRMGVGTVPQPTRVAALGSPPVQQPVKAEALGTKEVLPQHSLWRAERLSTAALVLGVSVAFAMLFFGFLEWTDPSFKSERHAARYLGTPVLGAIPNLDKLSQALTKK
jgi:hypothetical protein